jgi:hypothetical protein
MEIRLNLVLLGALGIVWATLTANEPVAAMDPSDPATTELAELEDRFALDRSDVVLARQLSTRYLEIRRPGLAIATLRSASPELLDDPMLAHRLAQAYEESGRMLDAFATADLALARCARSLGTATSSSATPLPRYGCSEREYAVLDVHRNALDHMVRWGVATPTSDVRTRLAYDIALRRAHVASANR